MYRCALALNHECLEGTSVCITFCSLQRFLLQQRLGGSLSRSECGGEEKNPIIIPTSRTEQQSYSTQPVTLLTVVLIPLRLCAWRGVFKNTWRK